jgi:hypothetical protein
MIVATVSAWCEQGSRGAILTTHSMEDYFIFKILSENTIEDWFQSVVGGVIAGGVTLSSIRKNEFYIKEID